MYTSFPKTKTSYPFSGCAREKQKPCPLQYYMSQVTNIICHRSQRSDVTGHKDHSVTGHKNHMSRVTNIISHRSQIFEEGGQLYTDDESIVLLVRQLTHPPSSYLPLSALVGVQLASWMMSLFISTWSMQACHANTRMPPRYPSKPLIMYKDGIT